MAILVCCARLSGQQTYFQQEVNYSIDVKLNDVEHSLSAYEEIEYINNSDKGLEYIYFHLWPNAYRNHQTALARQLLRNGQTRLYFAKKEELGYIDSLDFKVNGKPVKVEYDKEHIDICKIILNEPLRSLDTIRISTPFYVKIPEAKFSRLGHTGQAYFITQWYPKPAVFDNSGWHPMPYLDQGEFYSEFGSFDVRITLPKNYVLAATGDRIDASAEEDFLNNNVIRTIERLERKEYRPDQMAFPPSSHETKTIRFRQFRVHDFAWFADKRFNVLHDQIELPNTRKTVDTWVYFTNKNFEYWKDAIDYLNESTIFYSYLNGDYPYNNINAVDGTIMAGGGMEYPNITVIGDMRSPLDLDITMTHEVGHNWFYGILGSNERDYPALDEGLNSFYELRYIRAKYPGKKLIEYFEKDSSFRLLGLNKIPYWREKEIAYFYAARDGSDQPINTPSADFSNFNYGAIVYAKTAVVLDYLMDYMGEENFDKAMQFYYENFKFKHPGPADLAKTLSYFNGGSLDWFFTHLIQSNDKIDYKIRSVKRNLDGSYVLKVKNMTGTAVPLNIYAYKKNRAAGLVWSNGFKGTKEIGFPAVDADRFKIDGLDRMPDVNRKNNFIRSSGLFKKRKPLQLNFLARMEEADKVQLNYIPFPAYNYYNGPMAGLCLHNYNIYGKRFEWSLTPMFGFTSMSPAGLAEMNYHLFPQKAFQRVTLSLNAKSFAYDQFDTRRLNEIYNTNFKGLHLNYHRISPALNFQLKNKASATFTQNVTYVSHQLFTDSINYSAISNFSLSGAQKINRHSFVNELTYSLHNARAIDPFDLQVSFQHNDRFGKIFSAFNYQITLSPRNNMSFRVFAGSFLYGNEDARGYYAFRMSGYGGSDDYLFTQQFLARNENNGFGKSQFAETDGALKVPAAGLGRSTLWIAAFNLKTPRLFILPVRGFADVGICDGSQLNKEKVLWDAGVNVTLMKDIVEVYFPLAYSDDIRRVLDLNRVDRWNRVRFTLNLHKLAPRTLIKEQLY